MKTLDQVRLTPTHREALSELRQRLTGMFGIQTMSLFGSFARGEADEESDIDLLIITEQPLRRTVRHEITAIVFDVNLKYDTNFSTLVIDRLAWEEGLISVLPLRDEILKEGIPL